MMGLLLPPTPIEPIEGPSSPLNIDRRGSSPLNSDQPPSYPSTSLALGCLRFRARPRELLGSSHYQQQTPQVNTKASESLADPEEYSNLFEDWQVALAVESNIAKRRGTYPPAEEYPIHGEKLNVNLEEAFKSMQADEEDLPLENGDLSHECLLPDIRDLMCSL